MNTTIKNRRHLLGKTQAQLAEMTGIATNHLSEIETRARAVGFKRGFAIARALQLDITALFDEHGYARTVETA